MFPDIGFCVFNEMGTDSSLSNANQTSVLICFFDWGLHKGAQIILRVPSSWPVPSSWRWEKNTVSQNTFFGSNFFGVWQNTPRVHRFQWECPNPLQNIPWFAAHGARWRITTRAGNFYTVLLHIKKRKSLEAIRKSVDAFQSYSSLKTDNCFLFWYVIWFSIQNLGGPPWFQCLLSARTDFLKNCFLLTFTRMLRNSLNIFENFPSVTNSERSRTRNS